MNVTEARIRKALSFLQSGLFSALQNGPEALLSFHDAWRAFNTQLEPCVNQLQEETISNIHSFATTANVITSMLVEVDAAGGNLQQHLEDDMTKILRKEFKELRIHDEPMASDSQKNTAYIRLASSWLLKNLHNPYPSRDIRLEISTSTNSSMKDVDLWFTAARKRIGWNQLRKVHFPKRGDLIKAATLFFRPTQSAISSSKSLRSTSAADRYLDFAHSFVEMEERANELFSSKFAPSDFAADLEKANLSTVQDTRTNGQEWLELKADQRSSYPSPEYSPTLTSRSLSPASPQTSSCDSVHNEHASRKRRRSISPSDSLSDPEAAEQLVPCTVKRSRLDPAESLPSPAASVDDSLPEDSSFQVSVAPSTVPFPISPVTTYEPSGKRKRSLSDVDARVQKRPHITPRTQCHHFSDPIRPAEKLTEMNLEDLLVDTFGPNNEYAHGVTPATSPSFDEINQFGVEYQYDFPYEIMPDDRPDRDESESPGDTPELQNVALPQPPIPAINCVSVFSVGDVSSSHDIPLAWSDFDVPSLPGTEFWQAEQVLTNSTSMLSSGWPDDYMPISLESFPSQPFWPPLDDSLNNETGYYNLPATSPGTLLLNDTPTKTPEQLTYNDKCQKINQLHEMLAKVEVLRSELAL